VVTRRKKSASQEGHRQVILLTDQCYPAVLPAHGSAMCMKIIRREFGSLNQLAAELMDLARGKFEKESLVLIFSGTYLAKVGTVAYNEDLTGAVAAIKSVTGQEIKVAPLPPLFLGGCESKVVIRSCAEMSVWAESVFSVDNGYMQNSFRLAAQMMEAREDDEAQMDYTIRMRLPASTVPAGGKKTWDMGSRGSRFWNFNVLHKNLNC
jgi:hypothetical protein